MRPFVIALFALAAVACTKKTTADEHLAKAGQEMKAAVSDLGKAAQSTGADIKQAGAQMGQGLKDAGSDLKAAGAKAGEDIKSSAHKAKSDADG